MARAIWTASLQLGELELPVKLFAAVEDRDVHFRLVHAVDCVPVKQRMVDPRDGREVPPDEIRRGVEVEEGVFVIMRPEELEAAEPESSRAIEITRFVPEDAIDAGWYSRPYYLAPDGSERDYFALAEALRRSGRRGIARFVLRGKRQFGALAPRGEHLALIALHAASEVVPVDALARPPQGAPISKAERKLAEQLVAALDAPFDPASLRDEYRERVEKLIRAKLEGGRFEVKEPPPPGIPEDLGDALKRSVRTVKGGRRAAA
jgi:DNA end-binding protein Ku